MHVFLVRKQMQVHRNYVLMIGALIINTNIICYTAKNICCLVNLHMYIRVSTDVMPSYAQLMLSRHLPIGNL